MLTAAVACAQATIQPREPRRPIIPMDAQPFDLSAVRLLDGPFKEAQDADLRWLLSLEPDRLLAGFRSDAGLEPKAPAYGGWEQMMIAGHSLGHYLSACSLMYAATGDAEMKRRIDYICRELAEVQAANGNGYLFAVPEARKAFEEVAAGDIRSAGFDLNGIWVPWYTMHKIMAGLRDAYLHGESQQALDTLVKLADWAYDQTDALDEPQLEKMLACEHGGMNEVAADVYALTDDGKYLELARRFNHDAILDPLAGGEDILPGKHANTQVPKLIGAARQHELADDGELREAAQFFWDRVVHHHSYVTGGNSRDEHFGPPDRIGSRLNDQTTETCNTFNMLRLTKHLFAWEPRAELMDYYERALFNHILPSQHRETGAVCYFVPLRTGATKPFQSLDDAFTCCIGTGMENHARYGESIYHHGEDALWVNLFIASELDWRDKGLRLRQETQFPYKDTLRLVLSVEQSTPLTLNLRYPAWAGEASLRINGRQRPVNAEPGSYIAVEREWEDGDVVEFTLPMPLRHESPPDNDSMVALLKGPIVLAGELEAEAEPALLPAFVLDDPSTLLSHIRAGESPLTFVTQEVGQPRDLHLAPFFAINEGRYGIYWDVFTHDEWAQRQEAYRREQARQAALEARTVDHFDIGQMQPERDHDLQSEQSSVGTHMDRSWRHAEGDGFFEFTMKVSFDEPVDLVCTYWGDDAGRAFDILVEGRKLVTQRLERNRPGEFYDEAYPLPEELTGGKESVRVRFQPADGRIAGGLFACRVVRRES